MREEGVRIETPLLWVGGAQVHGEILRSREHIPWNEPIRWVRVRELVYLSIYSVTG